MEKKYKENKVLLFFKKNIYAILMVVCLAAIVALVVYTVVSGNAADAPDEVPAANVVDAEGNTISNSDQPKQEEPPKQEATGGTAAAGDQPAATEQDFVISNPIESAEILKDYVDSALVYNATMKHWATHQGVDYKADVGTAVRAVFDGEVASINTTTMRGTEVVVKHSNGFSTTYALLGPSVPVKVGDKVSKGDVVGYVAETGYFESADAPHLHFEVRRDGKLVDPNYYFEGNDNK